MNKAQTKKAANQANSKLRCISYTGYVLVKEIVSNVYSYLNELTLYAEVLYTQPSWYSFSSWPHSDITSFSRSATCNFLSSPFFTAEMLLG